MEDDYKCICGLGEEHTADCATYNSGREAGEKQGYEKGYNKALAQLADMTE